jgi:MoxR-like ATPase
MAQIVEVHFPGIKKALLREALEAFFEVREVPGLKKKPSTSELLDWLKLLLAEDIPPEALRTDDPRKSLPPLHGALLKNEQDVHLFEQLVFLQRRQSRQ